MPESVRRAASHGQSGIRTTRTSRPAEHFCRGRRYRPTHEGHKTMRRRDLLVSLGGAAAFGATRATSAAAGQGHRAVRPPNAALHWSGIGEMVIAPGRPPGSAGVLGGIV